MEIAPNIGTVMTGKRNKVAEAERVRAATIELSPLLDAFLSDPTESSTVTDWYKAVRKHCPLWALHKDHYAAYREEPDPTKWPQPLVNDLAWRIMDRVSRDKDIHGLWSVRNLFGLRLGVEKKRGVLQRPWDAKRPASHLVQAYRRVLLDLHKDPFDPNVVDCDELYEDFGPDPVMEEIRDLIVARLVATTEKEEEEADNKLDVFLKALGVSATKKPHIPNRKEFNRTLREELDVLLPLISDCEEGPDVTDTALARLHEWGCKESDAGWLATHLAFPCFSDAELRRIQSWEDHDQDRFAVFLIHSRVDPILKLTTVAKDAVGSSLSKRLQGVTNPLVADRE